MTFCFGLCESVRYWRVLVSTCGKDFIGYGKNWELRNRPGRCSSIWELMLLGKVSRWETRRLECWKTKTKNRTKARTSRYLHYSWHLKFLFNRTRLKTQFRDDYQIYNTIQYFINSPQGIFQNSRALERITLQFKTVILILVFPLEQGFSIRIYIRAITYIYRQFTDTMFCILITN